MTLFGLLKLLLSLAGSLTSYMREKQLLEAGHVQAIAANLTRTLDEIEKARIAKSAVKHDAGSVFDDPDNRDNP